MKIYLKIKKSSTSGYIHVHLCNFCCTREVYLKKKKKNEWAEGCNARVGDSWASSVEANVSFLERGGDTHTENGGANIANG